ncbi:EAL domain-containing protein [Pistricoccus aurantiacus]|uniref:bifunctional diguanylate cyclase/phosphodiesterase n=1 Tax=Pistricoccus aurantiacus TaxID=1883414 RepID=UPI00362F4E73
MSSRSPNIRRFSLTWRVIALTSLLLLALATLFTLVSRNNLTQQFEDSRAEYHERQIREIQLAFSRSADALRQVAALVAASSPLGSALIENDPERVADAFSAEWPALQLETGIDELRIFAADGRNMATWGEGLIDDTPFVEEWARQVVDSEQPLTELRCALTCQQYAAVPILVNGKSLGTVIASRSLIDVIRQTKQVSGSDVALMIADTPTPLGVAPERNIEPWNGHLVALTQYRNTLPILQYAATQTSLERLTSAPLQIAYQQGSYEIMAYRLAAETQIDNQSYLLLISDISTQLAVINRNTRNFLLIAVAGWLAAELLLLFILWKPTARLRRLSRVLPALAERGFDTVRARIPRPRHRFADEIDVMETTTLDLSDQLESLEQTVYSRSKELAERVKELARERDFIGSLLDTAEVFILAKDEEGRITLANEHAQAILGLDQDALLGKCFDEFFKSNTATSIGDSALLLDAASSNSAYRQVEETTLLIQNEQPRTIVWSHAILNNAPDGTSTSISVGLDITARKLAESRLTWLVQRDPLTELYNRRYFQKALENALSDRQTGILLFLDLDQFKDVNELSGHNTGDQLLKLVAKALQREFSHEGVVARLGGDEFALLVEGVDAQQGIVIAKRINQVLEGISLTISGRHHRALASIGIASYPEHGTTPAELMANADMAMYQAKSSGLQRWHLLTTPEDAREQLQNRVYWTECLRHALVNDGFELFVQPIVQLKDGEVRHYEVLLRMLDKHGKLISPQHFIPIAEQSGQIIALDRWVLRKSLKLLHAIADRNVSLAVNLSGQTLHDDSLKQYLADELAASGANPHRLILEVTETAAVTDFSIARGVLQGIRELGCRTALDDFGVGFSGFNYLGQLPVDYIKIDGSFIHTLRTSSESQVIVKAIADIANGFNKLTIAEFVDNEALIPMLKEYGITYGQGFYLGRPQPLNKVFDISMKDIHRISSSKKNYS